ncbi:MAG: hypothetical protein CVU05_00530 [Bacteroidetes bacterium HGW-Bacteroidetes-21]|nr:MAG: hypothetical protein CVU05_00530 [Bacteroidetes bacterium HGW-Bacteroidetes-21]
MTTRISIQDLLSDTIVQSESDGTLTLVYESLIGEIYLDSLLIIPDTTIGYTASLNNLSINDIIFDYSISLGSIAREDSTLNGPNGGLYETIMTAHNTGLPTHIQAIDPMTFDNIALNAGDYFQTITLENGDLEIRIDNHFPLIMTNVIYELKNSVGNQVLVRDTFLTILPNTSETHTHSLAGMTLENQLSGFVTLSSLGSPGDVSIDTSYALTAQIEVKNIAIQSAIARFPAQEILSLNQTADFANNDIQLTRAIIKEGMTNVVLQNTLGEAIHFSFEIPGAKLNNIPFLIQGTLPAGTVSNSSEVSLSKDLSNYDIDFKGIRPFELIEGDLNGNNMVDAPVDNSLYYKLSGSIDSSGNFINLSQSDFVSAQCSFQHIKPAYIKGYFGNMQKDTTGVTTFDLFPDIDIDGASFAQARLFLSVENQIGASAAMHINTLRAINTQNGQSALLSGLAATNPFMVTSASDPNSLAIPVTPTMNVLELNEQNSNIQQLVSVLPNTLEYNIGFELNPGQNPPAPNTGTDFAYDNAHLSCYLNTEIPLNLSFTNLQIHDTAISDLQSLNTENINYGNLVLYSYNLFPFDAVVNLYFLDSNQVLIDSLSASPILVNAGIPSQNGKVLTPYVTKSVVPFNSIRLENLKQTRKIKVTGKFNSAPPSQHVQVYNDYFIEFKLVGDFNYHIKP